jgi:flagellar biogenesis protein FliO
MASVDPVFLLMLAVLALIFFFAFLLVRRTLLEFRRGTERGRE